MGKADKQIKVIDWGAIIRNFLWDFILLTVLRSEERRVGKEC